MEMPFVKTIVVRLRVNHVGNPIQVIDSLFANTVKPDIVLLDVSSTQFPRHIVDLPQALLECSAKNPKVKIMWDGQNPFLDDEQYEILDVSDGNAVEKNFIARNISFKKHELLDMTMVSVFYDANVNVLRKVATRKAVSHWIEQYHLPDEMFFVELGFNGVYTFSQDDFPDEIQYVRIEGTDANKYLFQKEHIWNIIAKRAKNEKLMFLDSDISPLEDVDWFKQVYDSLDRCLFTQGFRSITYLDDNDIPGKKTKSTYTTQIVERGSVNGAVPGGAYCLCKNTLQIMGYFNYLPFGGGDNLFWSELSGSTRSYYPWFVLCKRDNVPTAMDTLRKIEGKNLLQQVYVDVYHFYHGDTKGRSYRQRHYMMMTQFPWMDRIITEDEQGLLAWLDTGHYFYNVMSQLSTVNDSKFKANDLMCSYIDYIGFVDEFENNMKLFQKMQKEKSVRYELVCMIGKWISKYSKRGDVK